MVFTPRPRISIQLRMSYAQIHNFRWFKILQARIFHELLRIFLSPEGTRIKEGTEQDFFSYYMINHRTNKGFIISLLLGIFFSNMRPRSDNYPPNRSPPSLFKQQRYKENLILLPHLFITFQPSTTAQSVQQNNLFSTPNFSIFMCLQNSFLYYLLF